jgi:glycerophosphoryl diester phosphodiesterase
MLSTPLLIGYPNSSTLLLDLERSFEQGCQGVRFDLQLKPFGRTGSNSARTTCYPRVQDMFADYGDRMFLDICVTSQGMEAEILEVVRQRGLRQNYVLSSPLPEVVMELKARSATVPVGLVCKRPSELARWRELPADYVIVNHGLITRKLIRMIHDSARRIFAWTVDDAKSMIRMAGWGVDGIISSDPQLLVETFAQA